MLEFKNWLEFQILAGGLAPPTEYPIDPDKPSRSAMKDYHSPGSDQLPPTKRKVRKLKQPCKIKF